MLYYLLGVAVVLSQLRSAAALPVSLGYEIGDDQNSILVPLSVTQCEDVNIFYKTGDQVVLNLYPPDLRSPIIVFTIPPGTGFITWRCTIPAGSSFIASAVTNRLFTVQEGSSSACLGDLSVNASAARVATDLYSSFTARQFSVAALPPDQA